MLEGIVFWICGGLMLLGGIMTVASRSAVGAAIWLIFAFLNAAGLFALLSAPFLAVLQVLVYAGAIMVLFLFVIMMLHGPVLGAELRRQGRWVWPAVALPVASLAISGGILLARGGAGAGAGFPALAAPGFGRAERVAALLLDRYLLAFELISVVLLVAIVGAVALGLAPRRQS
ncbi:MAG: NADH-quinone oxidoreductase subunit J [Candidatus Krumholzibacteriia bacterium]